ALLDVIPSTLDTSYTVELADGRISETDVILRGCTDKSKITRKQSKASKHRQARIRESVEYKTEDRKVKPQSKSAEKSQSQ
ncbi:hypothetical protein Tco_0346655, partial [Tanacetum coccineum]